MEKKKGIIITTIVVLLLLVVGVTYAFFTYESGTKSDIVTGQIYMNYEETSTISLTGVFPETKEQALARQDENGVFEFTITGRNTSKYPVYYEIDLLEGGVMTGKTETSTKILPEHVMIYLEKDGIPVIEGETYADFNNRRIYTDNIPANQTSNIEHKYTLRMWIDENVTISDTNPDANYTTSEWNDAYTSLKVRVVGDFEYKEVATDASCFAYIVPQNITLDTSKEKVEACMTNMTNGPGNGKDTSIEQDGYQSFCEGTGKIETPVGSMDLSYFFDYGIANGMSSEEMMSMLPVVGFEEGNEIEITNYDETCGTDVIIPSVIEGLPVTRIGGEKIVTSGGLIGGAFYGKGITSVKLPDTLKSIIDRAFAGNRLTQIVIPDNVTHIGTGAFELLNSRNFIVNPIEKIVNKSGKAFNWKNILDTSSRVTVQDPGVVATGTYVYNDGGVNREIQITSE